MKLILLLSFTILSCIAPFTTSSESPPSKCFDDANYSSEYIEYLNCKVLRKDEPLRRQYCVHNEIKRACPLTCGVCCVESQTFNFVIKKGNPDKFTKDCSWLGKNISRRKKYCFNFRKKAEIQASCQEACDLCRSPISPTISPKPTPGPTPIPTSTPIEPVDPWSFIVLADWHKAEYFSTQPGEDTDYYKKTYDQVKYIKENYGGDLVVLPGDTNGALPGQHGGGKWDTEEFAARFEPNMSVNERVELAGDNSYGAVRGIFSKAGYSLILVAVGDHELGGNSWGKLDKRKLAALPTYYSSFTKWYNTYYKMGELLKVQERVGSALSDFESTSFAYQHKNVLFITVDAFTRMDDTFMVRDEGLGGEGVITCTVGGKQMQWFKSVLKEARQDDSIRHIIVQSHVPVIQPVRMVACSGQFMDNGEESAFWKQMVKYNVDIYLAGEVHANTVTKDPDSNLIQIVSRGNQFSNFLRINVTDYTLNVTSYNEVGKERFNNMNYTVHGRLTVDKTSCMPTNKPTAIPSKKASTSPSLKSSASPSLKSSASPSDALSAPTSSPLLHTRALASKCDSTRITTSGVLEPLDRISALLHFNFEEIVPLGSRQVIGLQHDDHLETLIATSITIRGIKSVESLPNLGSFAQLYDAQIANVTLINEPSNRGTYYAQFTENSRFGIFGNGPHNPGQPVSFALWIKCNQMGKKAGVEMILVHYGHTFNVSDKSKKDIFTLTLKNGTPMLHSSPKSTLAPTRSYTLDDGEWHHIAVSMPKQNCRLSEVVMYVDGTSVPTKKPKSDRNIFFITSGKVSIGGFGHSNFMFDKIYPRFSAYVGAIDDFSVWSRTMEQGDFPKSH